MATGRYAFAQNGADFYVLGGLTDTKTTAAVFHYNAVTNTWNQLADIPVPSQAPVAAYFGGKIYLVDGYNLVNGVLISPLLHIYDVLTNTWSAGPQRPGVITSFGAAAGAFAGKIFVVGGDSSPAPTLSVYNILTNTWTSGPDAPASYQLGGYTQIGQFLYWLVASHPSLR